MSPPKTAEALAKQHGVSARTVIRDGKRAEALDRLEETKPEEAKAVVDGLKRFNEVRRRSCQKTSRKVIEVLCLKEEIPVEPLSTGTPPTDACAETEERRPLAH